MFPRQTRPHSTSGFNVPINHAGLHVFQSRFWCILPQSSLIWEHHIGPVTGENCVHTAYLHFWGLTHCLNCFCIEILPICNWQSSPANVQNGSTNFSSTVSFLYDLISLTIKDCFLLLLDINKDQKMTGILTNQGGVFTTGT